MTVFLMIAHRQACTTAPLSLDNLKTKRKVGTKKALTVQETERNSSVKHRLLLKKFAKELIETSFNNFTSTVDVLMKNNAATDDQETMFFIFIKIFLSIGRFTRPTWQQIFEIDK